MNPFQSWKNGEVAKSNHPAHHHRLWSTITLLISLLLIVQIPNVVGLTPVRDSGSALEPIKHHSFLSKAVDHQLHAETQTQTAIPADLRQCLNIERSTDGQANSPSPAYSTWVTSLGFRYKRNRFNENKLHTDPATQQAANQILQARVGGTNFVLAEVSVIRKVNAFYAQKSLTNLLPAGACFRSGSGNFQAGGRNCHGWDTIYANSQAYNTFLTNVMGIAAPNSLAHYHSEQALLAYLYEDASRCNANGLLHAQCRLGQALNGADACTIEAITLDIVSVPNSVCIGCDRALQSGAFLAGYNNALDTACNRPAGTTRLKMQVFTSSLNVYTAAYGHISCAGINHPEIVDRLTDEMEGITLHKLPANTAISAHETMQQRCQTRSRNPCYTPAP